MSQNSDILKFEKMIFEAKIKAKIKAKIVILKGHMSDFLKFEKMIFGAKTKAKIGQNRPK